ncbi:hypothetical protein [Chitinophaga eiseniae]|uniref:Uncharacterized protein n=1 Tax=Chitinophaga eiseniae TaxID=634771 RepID=A0A847SGC3_9BACT|nr:hypothetical protein [Chitinophaga eiseniae]NLR82300.1 hypothetical protein [Chitinophaga eiseniae]
MNKKFTFSQKPLDYVYALVWFGLFIAFAYYIFSGKMFQPDANGKIHIVAILVAWVAEYLTQIGTSILVLLIGLYISGKMIIKKAVN